MGVIKKAALGSTLKLEAKPKRTRQGQGLHSKPNHRRKQNRGQGRR